MFAVIVLVVVCHVFVCVSVCWCVVLLLFAVFYVLACIVYVSCFYVCAVFFIIACVVFVFHVVRAVLLFCFPFHGCVLLRCNIQCLCLSIISLLFVRFFCFFFCLRVCFLFVVSFACLV